MLYYEDAVGGMSPGTSLAGRYRIERLLSSDSVERRYLAIDIEAGGRQRTVLEWPAGTALTGADRTDAIRWYAEEIRRVQQRVHPALAVVGEFHAAEAAGPFYAIVEHVPGLTLAEEIDEAGGEISWREAVDWGMAIVDAQRYLHGQAPPKILGALPPQRIVLDSRTRRPVVFPDLGRWLEPNAVAHAGYAPFETLIGREEPRSDIYAVGALLFSLLAGRDLDAALASQRRCGLDLQRAVRAISPSPSALRGVPPALGEVLVRAMAFSAEHRFQDAGSLLAALSRASGPAVEASPAPAADTDERPLWTRIGVSQEAWFALPAAERNRRVLSLMRPTPPS